MDEFEAAGMKFVGRDTDNERMEIMELSGHPFYVAVQYHPEYLSRPMKPSAPYLGLILAATDKLQSFLSMVSSFINVVGIWKLKFSAKYIEDYLHYNFITL